jgi:translation initiation factor 4A
MPEYETTTTNNQKVTKENDTTRVILNEGPRVEGASAVTPDLEVFERFEDMQLREDLLRGIFSYGFEKPSAIQQNAIVPVIRGNDTIAQAHSGSGKTATFSISVLQRLDLSLMQPQALIVVPTRRLADQIHNVMSHLAEYMRARVYPCVGGTPVREMINDLRKGQQVIVGTPGRVFDMISRKSLDCSRVQMFVLDEADEMLSMGFREQIYDIFRYMPEDVQVALYSATLPLEVLDMTDQFMRDPVRILVKEEELTLEGIKQFYIALDEDSQKLEVLYELYETMSITRCIIFANTRRKVEWLADKLEEQDFTCSRMHGELDERENKLVMQEFRSGSTRVLVATDVLARGIDVQQVNLVINYDLPPKRENYIHRIGRSGRFGRKGCAVNFVTQADTRYLRDIETFYHTQIDEMPCNVADLL